MGAFALMHRPVVLKQPVISTIRRFMGEFRLQEDRRRARRQNDVVVEATCWPNETQPTWNPQKLDSLRLRGFFTASSNAARVSLDTAGAWEPAAGLGGSSLADTEWLDPTEHRGP